MEAARARALFDENAFSYDSVNHVISLGLDRRWRRWVAHEAVSEGSAIRLLDLMTGTGEVAIEAARLGARVVAVDVADEMMALGRERARWFGVEPQFLDADVTKSSAIPAGPFDAVTISFGLRYLDDPVAVLCAARERLEDGGRIVILEFCVPKPGPIASLASFYYFRILPHLASALGRGPELYQYLRDSTRAMGPRQEIEALIESAGFEVAESKAMGFGLVAGVVALKR